MLDLLYHRPFTQRMEGRRVVPIFKYLFVDT
jgi:hypothetical protein